MGKTAFLDQLEGAALQSKAYTEAACAAITQAVAGELAEKQDKLTGTQGQVVGVDDQGQAMAQDDTRYLKAAGGRGVGTYTFQRSQTQVDAIIINGDFSPMGSIFFDDDGSAQLFVCSDQNIKGGVYLATRAPTNGDILANLHVSTPGKSYPDTCVATKKYVDQSMPSGVIVLWSGAANAIPTGWALCNGQNGTPDLRDRFVLGAGNKYAVGEKGGEETVTLSELQIPGHTHDQDYSTAYAQYTADSNTAAKALDKRSDGATGFYMTDGNYIVGTTQKNHHSATEAHNNMPPYYTLCYIMKL